jgi:hypothetical protein
LDQSDVSKVFEVVDIFTLIEYITASGRRGLGEKTDILSPILTSVFLSESKAWVRAGYATLATQVIALLETEKAGHTTPPKKHMAGLN